MSLLIRLNKQCVLFNQACVCPGLIALCVIPHSILMNFLQHMFHIFQPFLLFLLHKTCCIACILNMLNMELLLTVTIFTKCANAECIDTSSRLLLICHQCCLTLTLFILLINDPGTDLI